MEKTRKAIAAAAAVFVLVGCAGGAAEKKDVPSPPTSAAEETAAADGGVAGREFVVLTLTPPGTGGERESRSRAVKLRDMELEARVGVAVRYAGAASEEEAAAAVLAEREAGADRFDAAEGSLCGLCLPLLLAGCLSSFEDAAPSAAGRGLNPSLRTAAGTFFITGPLVPRSLDSIACVLMDHGVAERFFVKDPTGSLGSGTWTWDDAEKLAAVIPAGSGIYRFGVSDGNVGDAALVSCGEPLTEGNGSAALSPTLKGRKGELIDRLAATLGDPGIAYAGEAGMPADKKKEAVETAFSDGVALFLLTTTGDVPRLRDAGVRFSVLPYPGAGASGADSTDGIAAVITCADRSFTGAVLPALDELSEKYVLAEEVDALLSGRASYDSASEAAARRILSSATYDLSLSLSGADGGEISRALTEAIVGGGGAGSLSGWELKAALLRPEIEKAAGGGG